MIMVDASGTVSSKAKACRTLGTSIDVERFSFVLIIHLLLNLSAVGYNPSAIVIWCCTLYTDVDGMQT